MVDMNAFFRRKEKLLWLVVCCLFLVFVIVEIKKNVTSKAVGYSVTYDYTYTQPRPNQQTTITREQTTTKGCISS
jgi:hypothetical protein